MYAGPVGRVSQTFQTFILVVAAQVETQHFCSDFSQWYASEPRQRIFRIQQHRIVIQLLIGIRTFNIVYTDIVRATWKWCSAAKYREIISTFFT